MKQKTLKKKSGRERERERERGTFNSGDENSISRTYQSLKHSKHIKINLEYANPHTNIQNIGINHKIILKIIFKQFKKSIVGVNSV